MKKLMMMAAATAALSACHGDPHDGPGVVYTSGPWYIQYENGHPIAADTTDPSILAQEDDLLDRINDHRVSIFLPALVEDSAMRDVARAHSIHMAMAGFTGFVNPEGDDPGMRADIAGIPWSAYAENIGYGWSCACDVMDEWLAAPGMHANIDDPHFVYAGVGYEHDSSSFWDDYWTADFRRP